MPQPPRQPGVYVEEVGPAVRAIAAASTSTTAFVGRAWRGPVDVPVPVSSFADFERRFGGDWPQAPMARAVRLYFENGGTSALIVRVATRNGSECAAPAAVALGGGLSLVAASPGTWGRNLSAQVSTAVAVAGDAAAFDLTVTDHADAARDADGRGGSGLQEAFFGLSLDPASPRFAPDVLARDSALVRIALLPAAGHGVVAGTAFADPASGHDGLAIGAPEVTDAANEAAGTGLYALDAAAGFNLLCLPPFTSDTTDNGDASWRAAAAFCAARRAVLLMDGPADATAATLVARTQAWQDMPRDWVAVYHPWLSVAEGGAAGRLSRVAPGGAVAGLIARTDSQRGVWKAPAGVEASLRGVQGLCLAGRPSGEPTEADLETLNLAGICPLRILPDRGSIVAWGARTLAGATGSGSSWAYLPVRRTAAMIETSLLQGTAWAVFEPNDEPLWAALRLAASSLLHRLFRQGAFAGSAAQEAFFVRCGADTHTANDVARGHVHLEVGFAPSRPAEFVVLRLRLAALPVGAPAPAAAGHYRSFRFALDWGDGPVAGFSRTSSLIRPLADPSAPSLDLEDGVTTDAAFAAWIDGGGPGMPARDMRLHVRDLHGRTAVSYRLRGCRVRECQSLPALDGAASAVAIHRLRLTLDALDPAP